MNGASFDPSSLLQEGLRLPPRDTEPRREELVFPFSGKTVTVTPDSEHFRTIDISREVAIPLLPHPGAFAAVRKHHTHEGVDLYCVEHEPVRAIESGRLVQIMEFTGPHSGSPWWFETFAVAIEGAHGILNYGEILPADHLRIGAEVAAGTVLGTVLTVLKKDKGRPRNMLHLELYEHGSKISQGWEVNGPRPKGLLDPTDLLRQAAGLK